MTGTVADRPPVRPSAFAGLDPCVHCGFCLPACPTYEVTADEADSPRGRIVLMRALERGEMTADDAGLQEHLDRCLGCRGCESACPSGVLFGPALEASRELIAAARPLPVTLRLALWVLARPERQRLLWAFSRMLRWTGIPALLARGAGPDAPRFVQMLAMLAATRMRRNVGTGERRNGTTPESPRSTVPTFLRSYAFLFRGCVMDGLFSHVHDATIASLEANGIAVREVRGQVCCGALAAHAGDEHQARELARENIRAFGDGEEPIVVNSAGCGAIMKSYGDLLAGEPIEAEARRFAARVRDVSEVLAGAGPAAGSPVPVRVAYDAPCHLVHAQRVSLPPRRLLDGIPGLVHVALEGSERCCGAAGLYSMIEPAMSHDVLALKLDAIRRAGPEVVATGNPGCIMQIGAGTLLASMDVVVVHPVELLARSYGR